MKCPKCNVDNKEGRRFCSKCGAKLENVCPECGFGNETDDAFCGGCGIRLSEARSSSAEVSDTATVPRLEELHARLQKTMPSSLAAQVQTDTGDSEGENRILTVLFADVSGSVATTENMSPEDAADLISECLKAMVDTILKYGGTINRFLGDSVLAFFGVPETHENDTERAILAALEMREAVTKLNLSISAGINTGMVYVGGIGPDSHREFAAMGTAVNLAARLEKEAEAGQILVGEATYRHTLRAFEFAPLEPLIIKGITEPVTAYEVVKQLPRPDKIRGIEGLRSDMIGRDREFSQLKECVDDLLQGRGQIISVIGEAGVGKSRMVSELKGYTADRDMTWLEGRCVSIGESIGYWVFTDILRSYLDFADDDTPEALREKIVSSMQAIFPQRWEEVVPYVGNLLSVRFGNEWDDRIRYLPAEQVKYQTFLTLRDIFHTLSQQKPLLLILEDLHWSDNLSLDLLNLMMDDLSLAPMLLMCVYRPYREHRSWHISSQASAKCLDRYTELTLRGLTEHESRRLVQSLLSIENLPDSIRESILQKAEGNPFFVEEVIRSLIESDIIHQDGDRWFARDAVSDITVPDTIQSVIMSRIDRLEDEVRYVLQSAAVIGRLFRHRLLQYTTQQEQDLDQYLWQLEDRDLVYEEHAIPELEYSFRHVLTQETAYSTILSRRRRDFHGKVAEGYEALYASRIEECYEELAYHYSRSNNQQKAIEYLVKAGDKSMEAFANDEAIAYYNKALELIDDTSPDSESASILGHIYQNLGEIYVILLKYDEALEFCFGSLEYTTDGMQRSAIYRTVAQIHEQQGKLDQALDYLNAAIAELGDGGKSPEMAKIYIINTWISFKRDVREAKEPEEAINIALDGLKIVENTENYPEIMRLYNSLTFICEYGNVDRNKALNYAEKSAEAARRSGSIYLIAESTFNLAWLHLRNQRRLRSSDGYETGLRLMQEAGEKFEGIGHRWWLPMIYYHVWYINQRMGNQDEGIHWLERCLRFPDHPSYLFYIFFLAKEYLGRGDIEKSISLCKEIIEDIADKDAVNESTDSFSLISMSSNTVIARSLGIMEEALARMGKRDEFIPFCQKLREDKQETTQNLPLVQWYLEPAQLTEAFTQTDFLDEFDSLDLKPEWEWVNMGSNSSFSLSSEVGWLQLNADPESSLRGGNPDAPRILQEITGDFAIEVKLKAASDDLSSMGGILVWRDKDNYIQFDKGRLLKNEISLTSNIENMNDHFGRGMLVSDVAYLRLESTGNAFSAYCSNNGESWLTCGRLIFLAGNSVQVGVFALGAATCFDYFRILRKES